MSMNEAIIFLQELHNEETAVAEAEVEVTRLQEITERRKKRVEALRNLVAVLEANPVDDETLGSTR